MKILTYLFINLYSWYYKDGNHKKTITPWFQAATGLAAGGGLWILLITAFYYHYVLNSFKITIPTFAFLLVILSFYILNYFLFVKGEKYHQMYSEYKTLGQAEKRKGKVISLMFIASPGLLLVALSWCWHLRV